jgi:hypothetical protein
MVDFIPRPTIVVTQVMPVSGSVGPPSVRRRFWLRSVTYVLEIL